MSVCAELIFSTYPCRYLDSCTSGNTAREPVSSRDWLVHACNGTELERRDPSHVPLRARLLSTLPQLRQLALVAALNSIRLTVQMSAKAKLDRLDPAPGVGDPRVLYINSPAHVKLATLKSLMKDAVWAPIEAQFGALWTPVRHAAPPLAHVVRSHSVYAWYVAGGGRQVPPPHVPGCSQRSDVSVHR